MYTITKDGVISRDSDGASIPKHPGNRDYREYQAWIVEGHTPKVEQPEDPDVVRTRDADSRLSQAENRVIFKALFKLENRVRTLEGEPLISAKDYVTLAKASYFEETT